MRARPDAALYAGSARHGTFSHLGTRARHGTRALRASTARHGMAYFAYLGTQARHADTARHIFRILKRRHGTARHVGTVRHMLAHINEHFARHGAARGHSAARCTARRGTRARHFTAQCPRSGSPEWHGTARGHGTAHLSRSRRRAWCSLARHSYRASETRHAAPRNGARARRGTGHLSNSRKRKGGTTRPSIARGHGAPRRVRH